MADARAPVAIRIARPYASDEELLQAEADTLSRAGIVLLGAPSRPEGTVLKFEVTLQDGTPVLRGEGRVTGIKTVSGQQGLALRFTRLDSKSKAFVDRATALRDARANKPSSSAQLPPAALPSEPSINDVPDKPEPEAAPEPPAPPPPRAKTDPPPPPAEPPPLAVVQAPAPVVAPSPDRASALDRLRDRAKKLTPEQIGDLLARGHQAAKARG